MSTDRSFVAVFDLDGTLTWRDTLLPYLAGFVARHPARISRLWRAPPAAAAYLATRDRGRLKSRMIRAALGGETRAAIDAWSDEFVANLHRLKKFRPEALAAVEAHRAAPDHLVLLSASPDLYVPRIGRLLGFERTVCTEVAWRSTPGLAAGADRLDGALLTLNRRGEEKCRCIEWIRKQYPGRPVVAYGNSSSDLPHLVRADRALLVNAAGRARRKAAACGIPTANWS